MNPIAGQQYRFKDLTETGPAEGAQVPNVFTVISVEPDHVSLLQAGSKTPTRFSRANFEQDFEPLVVA